eukprot:6199111-Pleurochrysis_carterae.AAC.3
MGHSFIGTLVLCPRCHFQARTRVSCIGPPRPFTLTLLPCPQPNFLRFYLSSSVFFAQELRSEGADIDVPLLGIPIARFYLAHSLFNRSALAPCFRQAQRICVLPDELACGKSNEVERMCA